MTIKILCGKLYDGRRAELQEDQEILIEGKLIQAVGRNLPSPENTEMIDLKDATVTPGMIDAHVHPSYFDWRDVYQDTMFNSDGYRALAVSNCARKTLAAGFTTIRTMGWFREDYVLDVKRAIEEGHLEGSRLVVAPHLLGTEGGHGDMSQIARTNPMVTDYLMKTYPGIGCGADFFTAAVRHDVKLGADFIKIMATGGLATPYDDPADIQLNDAELKAIFDTARGLGKSVTAHAYSSELIQKLIGFDIQGIEHGTMMDEETARMMEDNNVYLVPTLCPTDDAVYMDEESLRQKSDNFRRKLMKYQGALQESRKVILNSNIKLGYGTDFVSVHQCYESGYEYSAFLRNGFDPFRALQAATKNNAEICEIDDIVGTIEVGKYADISAWRRDLLADPNALRDCAFVMKEGKIYTPESQIDWP